MKKRMSWYWALPGMVGLAFLMAAVMLLVSTAGHTPTASAQAGCILSVTKTANPIVVPTGVADSAVTYTITVDNTGTAECTNVTITDDLPADVACDETTQPAGWTPAGCAQVLSETVTWTADALATDAALVTLTLVADLGEGADRGEIITNTAVGAADTGATGDSASVDVYVSDCDLSISKDADPDDEVGEGGDITYTLTISNDGDADCDDVVVVETIPDGTDCTDTGVTDDSDLDEDDFDVGGCDGSGTVTWDNFDLGDNDALEVTMTVDLEDDTEEGDDIDNIACVVFDVLDDDDAVADLEDQDFCDSMTIDVEGVAATATPTTGPTATARPPTVQPPVAPPPVVAPAPTIAPPVTGTGSDSGASSPLAIGLGLAGLALLLVSGVVLVKRTR